jgi:hypothetical protein
LFDDVLTVVRRDLRLFQSFEFAECREYRAITNKPARSNVDRAGVEKLDDSNYFFTGGAPRALNAAFLALTAMLIDARNDACAAFRAAGVVAAVNAASRVAIAASTEVSKVFLIVSALARYTSMSDS